MKKSFNSGALRRLLDNRERSLLLLCSPSLFPAVAKELLRSLAGGPGRKVFFGKIKTAKEVDLRHAVDAYFVDQSELIFTLLRRPFEIESLTTFLTECDVVVFLGYRRLFEFLRSSGLYYRFVESIQEKRVVLAEITPDESENGYLPWMELVDIDEVVIAGADGIKKRHSLL